LGSVEAFSVFAHPLGLPTQRVNTDGEVALPCFERLGVT